MSFRLFETAPEIYETFKESFVEHNAELTILDNDKLSSKTIDWLVYNAVFNKDEYVKSEARQVIRSLALPLGIRLSSIQGFYEAMGRGECGGFSVPAINIRGMTFDCARAVFKAAMRNHVGPFIFEIAKSEIEYTNQRPLEYTAVILAAAIKEGYRGPVFIQGDHFQVNANKYAEDSFDEIGSLKKLISDAIDAGFYNIDIDASTLVDLTKHKARDQQAPNFMVTAELTRYIRGLPSGDITVSIGGEIGEVGKKNSTEAELRAFMDGYNEELPGGMTGISKMSIQTGTSHGGVPLPNGKIAEVNVDFDTINKLSVVAREDYGLSGVVQHGASTLPDNLFHLFPERGASEVHLATGFQNQIYDHPMFPKELKDKIYTFLGMKFSGEKKEGETKEQFIYKTRKKAFGPFKENFWNLPPKVSDAIRKDLEDRFDMLFKSLKVVNTAGLLEEHIGD